MGNTEKLEDIFTKTLHTLLKEQIVGKVFVKVDDDDRLIVKIESFDSIKWIWSIENFFERAIYGYTAEYAAYEIVGKYRKFVMAKMQKKYFK